MLRWRSTRFQYRLVRIVAECLGLPLNVWDVSSAAEVALDVQACPAHAERSLPIVGGRAVPREHAVSVADRIGLRGLEGALMAGARAAWRCWVTQRLVDGVVDDLVELPAWALASPDEAKRFSAHSLR
jgi:hypothetical protein